MDEIVKKAIEHNAKVLHGLMNYSCTRTETVSTAATTFVSEVQSLNTRSTEVMLRLATEEDKVMVAEELLQLAKESMTLLQRVAYLSAVDKAYVAGALSGHYFDAYTDLIERLKQEQNK